GLDRIGIAGARGLRRKLSDDPVEVAIHVPVVQQRKLPLRFLRGLGSDLDVLLHAEQVEPGGHAAGRGLGQERRSGHERASQQERRRTRSSFHRRLPFLADEAHRRVSRVSTTVTRAPAPSSTSLPLVASTAPVPVAPPIRAPMPAPFLPSTIPPTTAPAPAPIPMVAASFLWLLAAVMSIALEPIPCSLPLRTRVSKSKARRASPLTRPDGTAAVTWPRTSEPAGTTTFSPTTTSSASLAMTRSPDELVADESEVSRMRGNVAPSGTMIGSGFSTLRSPPEPF